jgi:hypothetical protein
MRVLRTGVKPQTDRQTCDSILRERRTNVHGSFALLVDKSSVKKRVEPSISTNDRSSRPVILEIQRSYVGGRFHTRSYFLGRYLGDFAIDVWKLMTELKSELERVRYHAG